MTARASTVLLCGLLGLIATGCQEDFEPFSRLSSLRVLAVQSEPAAPATGETTTLSPLIYTPPGVDIDSYEWSWCPFPGNVFDGYPCLISEQDLEELGGLVGEVPPFDLGGDETATLSNTLDPELLTTLCTGTPQQPSLLDCTEGFPVQVRLVVRTASEEITAVRRLQMRFAAEHAPNANPVIDGIAADIDGDDVSIETDAGPTLPRGEETLIRAQFSVDHSESFDTLDDFGMPVAEQERLIVSWFTETGDVDSERTTFISGSVDLSVASENAWEPGPVEDYAPDTSELIVVLRDSRGGVSWISGRVDLGDEP